MEYIIIITLNPVVLTACSNFCHTIHTYCVYELYNYTRDHENM